MPAFNKFHCFVEDLSEGKHNLGSDNLKLALTNSAPANTNTIFANISDLAAGGGYTAGGKAVTVATSAQSSGLYKLIVNDVVFTATTGFGPFRYIVLYNSSAAGQPLIGWYDAGSPITIAAAQTFTADFDPTNGVLTLV